MKLLHIVFASLNPDYTWTPRHQTVKVEDIYAQNESQKKETANLWANSDEVVFSVVSEDVKEPRLHFRAAKPLEIHWVRCDHFCGDLDEDYVLTYEQGEMIEIDQSAKGFTVKGNLVLAYHAPDCDGWTYYDGYVDKNDLICFYYDEKDNEVVVPLPF